ncbi:MAG: hypothetical protein ACE366_12895 [Bradymonadia bacterium]
MASAVLWSKSELEALAKGVAEALSARSLPRTQRGLARKLLARAFDALEGDPAEDTPMDSALCVALDDLLHPREVLIPRPPSIGLPPLPSMVNAAWVERLSWPLEMADARIRRVEAFLTGAGFEYQLPEERDLVLSGPKPDFEYTRG